MRRRTIRRVLMLLAPGGLLFLSCPSGTVEFLAPIVQPIVADVLTQVADAFTDRLLSGVQQP